MFSFDRQSWNICLTGVVGWSSGLQFPKLLPDRSLVPNFRKQHRAAFTSMAFAAAVAESVCVVSSVLIAQRRGCLPLCPSFAHVAARRTYLLYRLITGWPADPAAALFHHGRLPSRLVRVHCGLTCRCRQLSPRTQLSVIATNFCSEAFTLKRIISPRSSVVGVLLPVYETLKTVEAPQQTRSRREQQWMTYWALYSTFTLLEQHTSRLLTW